MKILSLGLDIQALDPTSQVAFRIRLIGQLVDFYTVVVPAHSDTFVGLNNKAEVYAIGGSNKIVQLVKVAIFIYQIFKERNYDLVTVQDTYYLALVGWFVAWYFGKPLEIQVHGFEKKTIIRLLITRFIFKRANGIRVVSSRLKKLLVKKYHVDSNKIYVIPVGVKDMGEIILKGNYKSHSPFNFLTVGRLAPIKRIDFIVRALAKAFTVDDNFTFNIFGEGPERSNLESLVGRLNLDSKVNFLGYQKDLTDIYKNADAFLFSSKEEGWGLVLVEAALHGLPIVTTDVGLVGEVLVDDQDVKVVPFNNIELFSQAIKNLYTDIYLREKLGQSAHKKAMTIPKSEDVVESYIIAWQKLLR